MIRKLDVIEVFPWKRKKLKGWRFRMFLKGGEAPIYTSENLFDDPDRAMEVARKFNEQMYCGEYAVKRRRVA